MVDEAGSLKSMKPRIHIQSDNNKSGAFKFERYLPLVLSKCDVYKCIVYSIGFIVISSFRFRSVKCSFDLRRSKRTGMDRRTENNPYLGFICTQFQERATFISHGNTARLAKEHGDLKLAQICGTIATHEKRHETTYTKIVEKLFEIDHVGTVLAFADMMRKNHTLERIIYFSISLFAY
ncbi:hypothetical protein CsatB_011942 [Cannabis sativa]